MLLPPYELHERVYLLRIYTGMNQEQLAELLGMTQSWVSKFEAGTGELTVEHLKRLRAHFGVSIEAILDGMIPYAAIGRKANVNLRIPKRYTRNGSSRVRILYGFVALFEKELGEKATAEFIRSLGIDPEILANPDFVINLELLSTLVDFGESKRLLLTEEAWQHVAQESIGQRSLGAAASRLTSAATPADALETFSKLASRLSSDFVFETARPEKEENSIEIFGRCHYGRKKPQSYDSDDSKDPIKTYYSAVLREVARASKARPSHLRISGSCCDPQSKDKGFRYHVKWA